MQTILPNNGDTRVIKRFALFPIQGFDNADNKVQIWLETYYQKQTADFRFGTFIGWVNTHWPTTSERDNND